MIITKGVSSGLSSRGSTSSGFSASPTHSASPRWDKFIWKDEQHLKERYKVLLRRFSREFFPQASQFYPAIPRFFVRKSRYTYFSPSILIEPCPPVPKLYIHSNHGRKNKRVRDSICCQWRDFCEDQILWQKYQKQNDLRPEPKRPVWSFVRLLVAVVVTSCHQILEIYSRCPRSDPVFASKVFIFGPGRRMHQYMISLAYCHKIIH